MRRRIASNESISIRTSGRSPYFSNRRSIIVRYHVPLANRIIGMPSRSAMRSPAPGAAPSTYRPRGSTSSRWSSNSGTQRTCASSSIIEATRPKSALRSRTSETISCVLPVTALMSASGCAPVIIRISSGSVVCSVVRLAPMSTVVLPPSRWPLIVCR
ncbi:Protein of unknown function [Thermobacillus xylanilyticus]|uniref:Uncharacterized protein n=1 Tax=Thermobacillus xylanilyticus TaxID=76633 RepID=A0ABN7S8I4_THEXY|nr:Protein of unknown function [Thermobacillus xylanilyticus]